MKRKVISIVCFILVMLLTSGCAGKPTGSSSQPPQSNTGSESDSSGSSAPGEVEIDMKNEVGVTVNFTDKINEDVVAKLKDNGVTYARIVFSWPFLADGASPNNAYLASKKAAKMLHDAGIKIMAQSFWPGGRGYDSKTGAITWISNLPNVYTDFEDEYFYKATENAVKFMAKDIKDICSTWLISNEIDISTYTGDMTFDQIVRYVEAAASGAKAGNPNAACGVNMLVAEWEAYSLKFVDALYGKKDSKLDWLGIDGYYGTLQKGDTETWEYYINTFHDRAKVPMVITEWSYSSAEKDPSNSLKFQWEGHGPRGQETQAEYLKECMKVFARHPEVVGTFWYALHDQDVVCWECGNPECKLYSSWGLLNVDSSPKPSLAAMGEASKLFRDR